RPRVIAITALGRDDFIRRAIALGVSYYMVKPIEIHTLMDRIRDVIRLSEQPAAPLPLLPLPGASMDDKLSNIFLSIGIPAHIKGYQFLREAVKLVVNDHNMIGAITKELYPTIAHTFATTPSKVERAIRHAIEVAWNRGRVDTLNKTFGCTVALPTEKPTNGEFIALLADKLSVDLPA
ncbi:MAG: sporulation transcription factor Spo0A, partial [Clostridia bacterium]|nr:sporulation transcription factor Spo0A [Clostridia bacterium]